MKKYFVIFSFMASVLYAQYCIEVNRFPIKSSQEKMSEIKGLLNELPYPSTVVKNGYISVCTGRFKDEASAKALLPLTKSRYKRAVVISNDGAKNFVPNIEKAPKKDTSLYVSRDTSIKNNYYAVEIGKFSYSEYKNRQEYIYKILDEIPFSELIEHKGFYTIRTGAFKKRSNVDMIYSIIKRKYADAKIISYSVNEKSLHVKSKPIYEKQKKELSSIPKSTKEKTLKVFDVTSLNGTIDKQLMSSKDEDESLLSKYNDIQRAVASNQSDTFSGFYLKANTAWDTLNDESAYDVRLEWDMYDQGYYQSKRIDEQKDLDKKIELFRSLNYIQSLSRDEAFRKMKYYLNGVNSFEIISRLKVQEKLLKELQAKYEARLITQYEYDTLLFSIEKNKESLKYYHNLTLLKIPAKLWQLLNQIEYVRLKESAKLFNKQKENSVDNELYNVLVKKNMLQKSWSDKLRLNFYVGQRKLYASQDQSLIGVDAKIPLTSYTQDAELETLQNRILKEQLLLKERQNRDALTEYISLFIYKQSQLKTRKEELKRLAKHIKVMQKVDALGYGELISKRGKSQNEILLEYHDKHLQILLERFEVYKLLVEILYKTKSSDFSDLLEYALPDYVDHREERIWR
jgi:hypothetical protein